MGPSAPACLLWHLPCQLAGLCGQPAALPRPRTSSPSALPHPCCPLGAGQTSWLPAAQEGMLPLQRGWGLGVPPGTSPTSVWLPGKNWRPVGRLQQGQDALTRVLAPSCAAAGALRSLGLAQPGSWASPVPLASPPLSLPVPAAPAPVVLGPNGLVTVGSCASLEAQPPPQLLFPQAAAGVPMGSTCLRGLLAPTSP